MFYLIEKTIDAMMYLVDKMLDGVEYFTNKVISGLEYFVELLVLGPDMLIMGFDYSMAVLLAVCYQLTTPFKFAIFWCMCKTTTYEMVVLLTINGRKVLALSTVDKDNKRYCNVSLRYMLITEKFLLNDDGSVTDIDADCHHKGFVTNWLPRLDKEKRLFMILSGARSFIT